MSCTSFQVIRNKRLVISMFQTCFNKARRLMAIFMVLNCLIASVEAAPTILFFTPPPNGTYTTGASLLLRATYSEPVKVTGNPSLPVLVGNKIRNAIYSAGSGTKVIVFKLTVEAGDSSIRGLFGNNGIRLTKSLSIEYPSNSTITSIKGEQASQALPDRLPIMSDVRVDTVAPRVISSGMIEVVGNVITNKAQSVNQQIYFTENVNVTGRPFIDIKVGKQARRMLYTSGSGTPILMFKYTFTGSEGPADFVPGSTVVVPQGSAIRDFARNSPSSLTAVVDANKKPGTVVFRNVDIYDGVQNHLIKNQNVLVNQLFYNSQKDPATGQTIPGRRIGSFIVEITPGEFKTPYNPATAQVIDGTGYTLMPGLIDTHYHLSWANSDGILNVVDNIDAGKATSTAFRDQMWLNSHLEASAMLSMGYTALRDVGGFPFDAKKKIDAGLLAGPRVWPSGAMISQTAGHADLGGVLKKFLIQQQEETDDDAILELAGTLFNIGLRVADGVPDVLSAVNDQFVQLATQIKICKGGGITSNTDPVDVVQFTKDETNAMVEAATNWGTYVLAHAYSDQGIQDAINSGVRCIEHGNLATEATVKMMRDNGTFWVLSPFFDDENANPKEGVQRQKQIEVQNATKDAYRYAKQYNVKLGFGTDIILSTGGGRAKQNKILADLYTNLTNANLGYTRADILHCVTANNGELLTLSGPRTPYNGHDGNYLKPGDIGQIKTGAVADLLLIKGNPLDDMELFKDYDTNLLVIMKDGVIYKNILNK